METRLFLGEPAREARGRQVEGKQALPGDGVSGGRERRAGAGVGLGLQRLSEQPRGRVGGRMSYYTARQVDHPMGGAPAQRTL